ncbi:MAG: hypothetical protein PF495_20410, partial [Spirochaetales bacterium]|nr:hypothetical protein [Spirochaetales bacterium]
MSVDNRANELEILDKERLVMLFGDSRELLEEIYQIVQSDFPELSHKLETAVKQQNYEDISQYAHT